MKKLQGFRKRMLISSAFFILIVTLLCLGVVYYWSFFHFSHLFEDRVIDSHILIFLEGKLINNTIFK